jgi:hypothetical protein
MAKQPRPLRGALCAAAAPGLTRGAPTPSPTPFGPRSDGSDTGGPSITCSEQACLDLGG